MRVSGGGSLSFLRAFVEIAAAAGRDIAFVDISADDFIAEVAHMCTPREFVKLAEILTKEVLDGRNSHLADGVRAALGRPPHDFIHDAKAAAANGVWGKTK